MRKKKEYLRNNHKNGDNFNPSWPVIQFLAPAAAGNIRYYVS